MRVRQVEVEMEVEVEASDEVYVQYNRLQHRRKLHGLICGECATRVSRVPKLSKPIQFNTHEDTHALIQTQREAVYRLR